MLFLCLKRGRKIFDLFHRILNLLNIYIIQKLYLLRLIFKSKLKI